MASGVVSREEYLKRYLNESDDKDKKKKRKKKTASVKNLTRSRIVDDDVDFKSLLPENLTNTLDEDVGDNDPTVAAFVDERPESIKQLEQYRQDKRWKVITKEETEHQNDSSASENSQVRQHKFGSGQRRQRHDSDSDQSPPEKQRHDSDSDKSPPRKQRHDSDSDQSPQRKQRHDSGSDQSPPRKQRHDSDSDQSPPRKKRHDSDSDQSPPRKQNSKTSPRGIKRNSDSDQSPPRRKARHSVHNQSHSRTKKGHSDSDQSPPRRKRYSDSDQSPPRRKQRHSDSDQSPPRGKKRPSDFGESPKRRKPRYDSDESPTRPKKPLSLSGGSRSHEKDRQGRATKTLSGAKAGLQSAKSMREEAKLLKQREENMFKKIGKDVLGKDTDVVFRDRGSGRKRNLHEEKEKTAEELAEKAKKDEQYKQWGKGLKQSSMQQAALDDAVVEMSKPLARHRDDADLDKMLREQDREGDPMLAYIKKKKKPNTDSTGKELPRYKGPEPPPNRFNIWPGYRWDGVDRSNGFEKQFFAKMSSKKAIKEIAYKWSTEDM